MGSNGLTSARHDVFSKDLAKKFPESYDPHISDNLSYSGTKKLLDNYDKLSVNVGKLILSPTRTYAPVFNQVFKKINKKNIHGIIHCSGGAQTKILHFVDKLHIVKDNLFEIPPLFNLIKEESGTDLKEMFEVFNMGHRMEIYIEEKYAHQIIDISKSFNIEAKVIGHVESAPKKQLTIKHENSSFIYN